MARRSENPAAAFVRSIAGKARLAVLIAKRPMIRWSDSIWSPRRKPHMLDADKRLKPPSHWGIERGVAAHAKRRTRTQASSLVPRNNCLCAKRPPTSVIDLPDRARSHARATGQAQL